MSTRDTEGGHVPKEPSMIKQKELLSAYYDRLVAAPQTGQKVVYTFVPGNLTELLLAFDVLPVLPEINALQSAMRGRSGDFIAEAERAGHSEDVCSYVKCDLGMLRAKSGPTGKPLPPPDLLLLSYTGCFTFMKWFELLKQEFPKAEVAMLHVPYQADGVVTPEMRQYVLAQLREEVVPKLERITGKKLDEDRLRELMEKSALAEDDFVAVLEAGKKKPSPIDGYFGAVFYIAPLFSAFRGTDDGVAYYRLLREEVEQRAAEGRGPITPLGQLDDQRIRLVVEGPPCWTSFRELWSMFAAEKAVVVASTYCKVGGLYDTGFRHDPRRPFDSLADYCLGCYTNLSLPSRTDLVARYVREYQADGFLVHSVKSCNSFSAGQLLMLRSLEKKTGVPGGFLESDLVDPRYFSGANVKNRLESYFQMLLARRGAAAERAAEVTP
ncbi:MAG: benzoyl-CoA reductase subunit B [Deltaproteobacteria bacterium]|nr:benzoyl-CoA reductase subunit B [Deltaproteobacteria bacterium]